MADLPASGGGGQPSSGSSLCIQVACESPNCGALLEVRVAPTLLRARAWRASGAGPRILGLPAILGLALGAYEGGCGLQAARSTSTPLSRGKEHKLK
jgi:hypothetical protein